VISGSIIGLAIVLAAEDHPPPPAAVVGELVLTALAFGLSDAFGEMIGTQTRARRHLNRSDWARIAEEAGAFAIGAVFPAIFFLLATAEVITIHTAFVDAKWSEVILMGLYGWFAGRLAGHRVLFAFGDMVVVVAVAVALVELKTLLH
jgi:hypothetical protein